MYVEYFDSDTYFYFFNNDIVCDLYLVIVMLKSKDSCLLYKVTY